MKASMLSILGILLSCLLASCASQPPPTNTSVITSEIGRLIIYPDIQKNVVYPGEPIVFEFTPTVENININAVRIDTGESGKPALGCGYNKSPCKEQTVRAVHKYEKEGAYKVVVRYQEIPVAEQKIIILEHYLTDKELHYKAIKEIAMELKRGIKQVAVKNRLYKGTIPKFAFSSLKDANFEYVENQRDVEVIYSLMQAIIEDESEYSKSDYAILERAPQALVRLAHESVYKEDPSSLELKQEPEKQLEYGLRTVYKSTDRPFVYGAELVGVDDTFLDRRRFINSVSNREGTDAARTVNQGNQSDQSNIHEGRYEQINKERGRQKEYRRRRPVMFAKFDTADFLVVIDRIEYGPVQRSGADYYDTTYDAKAIRRTATVKVNARILDKTGRIMWIKNIAQQVSDLVLPQFAPPVQTWTTEKESKRTTVQ